MAINEDYRQVEIAAEVEQAARTLAHSTCAVPNPVDSYDMLGELARTVDHLEQVARQLGRWHGTAVESGRTHPDQEVLAVRANARKAAESLARATDALSTAADELRAAHSANAVIRWTEPMGETL